MKERNSNDIKNLEMLTLQNLKYKYEKEGFKFKIEPRRTFEGKQYYFDGYAYNKELNEEIVFEVKSIESLAVKNRKNLYSQKRELVRKCFGDGVKFHLVIAQEDQPSKVIESAQWHSYLLDFIKSKKYEELKNIIPNIRDIQSLEDVVVDSVDLRDFNSIFIKGTGNLLFYEHFDEKDFKGVRLTDGITFSFEVTFLYTPSSVNHYEISSKSLVKFIYKEFADGKI